MFGSIKFLRNLTLFPILVSLGTFAEAGAKITVIEPSSDCPTYVCGTAFSIYIDGEIGIDDGKRLEALIEQKRIPIYSNVHFNSPGGALYGGLDLARVIRKYGFNTSVTKLLTSQESSSDGAICMSACSLAYLGGISRYFSDEALFGVHRFYSDLPAEDAEQTAQIASAEIIRLLMELDIKTEFFVEMTKAGSQDMRFLDQKQMEQLGIANNGIGPTTWEVKAPDPISSSSFLYLKGERNTVFGINKIIFLCSPSDRSMVAHVIFDPQGRTDEALMMNAISIQIDGSHYPFTEFLLDEKKIVNDWLNASFRIPQDYWAAIQAANTIGFMFQFAYEAPVFLGISEMSLDGAKGLMAGIGNSCPVGKEKQNFGNFNQYQDTDFLGADLTERGFKGVSLPRCEEICNSLSTCNAYSFVKSSQWCFPKSGTGKRTTKIGTVSGLK